MNLGPTSTMKTITYYQITYFLRSKKHLMTSLFYVVICAQRTCFPIKLNAPEETRSQIIGWRLRKIQVTRPSEEGKKIVRHLTSKNSPSRPRAMKRVASSHLYPPCLSAPFFSLSFFFLLNKASSTITGALALR